MGAGSWARRKQGAIGNVVAGSAFAKAQGVGMGAPMPLEGYVLGGMIGGALGVGVKAMVSWIAYLLG